MLSLWIINVIQNQYHRYHHSNLYHQSGRTRRYYALIVNWMGADHDTCRLWCHPWCEASLWSSKEAEATEIPREAETRLSARGRLFLKLDSVTVSLKIQITVRQACLST